MLPNNPVETIDVSRRQLLLSSGSLVAGTSALAWFGSDKAAAAINVNQIDIPNTEVETPDGSVDSVQATITGNYQYSANDADTTRLALLVAPPEGEYQEIDQTQQSVASASGSGSYTLNGSVLSHDNILTSLFSVEPETEKTITLPIRVRFEVLFQDSVVVEALAEGAADVTVVSGEIVASAAVLGDGSVAVTV